MKTLLCGTVLASALAIGGVAMAQSAPAQPAPPPPPPHPEMGAPGGPPGWMRGGMMRRGGGRETKAARFMLRKGDSVIAIKCADDEPTKACVDAAVQLLDKAVK